jgi:hypothetical protein
LTRAFEWEGHEYCLCAWESAVLGGVGVRIRGWVKLEFVGPIAAGSAGCCVANLGFLEEGDEEGGCPAGS